MSLLSKITDHSAQIGIIGLGYVGLPLVIEFCKAGFSVTGFDIDPEKVRMLNEGKSYIRHIDISSIAHSSWLVSSETVQGSTFKVNNSKSGNKSAASSLLNHSTTQLPQSGRRPSVVFSATSDFSLIAGMDIIIICVPTPLDRMREPDMSYVFGTAKTITKYLRKNQLVILESTTYPGTTDEDLRKYLEESGLEAGRDFHLAFSPEREDPANKDFSIKITPKIVGGYTPECLALAKTLYDKIVDRTIPVSSTRVAEAAKLLENIYRSVNIALVNELKMLFDRMDIDIWEVIEAAKTKPFGFQPFYPGPGIGGHCVGIDPFYLTWKAREYNFATRFIELAGEINTVMPDFVISKAVKALNDAGKPVKGSSILIIGLAYKANVDDDRESPSYRLMDRLEKMGAKVNYNDPYIPIIRPTRDFPHFAGRKSVEISCDYDLMIILTPHDEYISVDFSVFDCPIVDTRNIVRNAKYLYKA